MPVFAERGYQAPTIADLVVVGKVSAGGFYELYGAKEACFLAVLDECIMRVRERIAAAIRSAPSCSGKLLVVLGTIAKVIETEPEIANTILVAAPTAGAAARERHDLVLSELADLLRSGRKPGMGGAAIPANHEFVAVAGISWVLQDRLARRETAEIQAVLRELGNFFFAAYTEPNPARGSPSPSRRAKPESAPDSGPVLRKADMRRLAAIPLDSARAEA